MSGQKSGQKNPGFGWSTRCLEVLNYSIFCQLFFGAKKVTKKFDWQDKKVPLKGILIHGFSIVKLFHVLNFIVTYSVNSNTSNTNFSSLIPLGSFGMILESYKQMKHFLLSVWNVFPSINQWRKCLNVQVANVRIMHYTLVQGRGNKREQNCG